MSNKERSVGHHVTVTLAKQTFRSKSMTYADARALRATIQGVQGAVHDETIVCDDAPSAAVTLAYHNTCLDQAAQRYNELSASTVQRSLYEQAVKKADGFIAEYNNRGMRVIELEKERETLWTANDSQLNQLKEQAAKIAGLQFMNDNQRESIEQLQTQVKEIIELRQKDFMAFASTKNDLERDLKASNEQLAEAVRERDANYRKWQNADNGHKQAVDTYENLNVASRKLIEHAQACDIVNTELLRQVRGYVLAGNSEKALNLISAMQKVIAG